MRATEPSPFALAQPELARMGYSAVIPLIPPSAIHHAGRGKAPGAFVSGTWRGLTGWQKFRDTTPSTFEIGMWSRMPDANVGLLLGTHAGGGHQVIAIDIDVTDADELALLQSVLPTSPMSKRAAKGVTLMYRATVGLKSRSYDRAATETTRAERLVDLLAGGRQTCLPPSKHPAGVTYQWVTGPAAPNDLPVLTEDDLEKLEDTLESMGWVRDGRTTGQDVRPGPRAALGAFDPSDPWSVAKAQALARLDEWFPDLDLPGTRRARGGWEAVAVWRASSTGRPVDMRKRNLSASSTGIRDWGASGDDAGLTAIDVVQRALDLTASEALIWLQEKLGIEDDDGDVIIDLAPTPTAQTKAPPAASEGDETEGVKVLGGTPNSADAAAAPTHGLGIELPEHLTYLPGLVGEITDWITATARKPQRALALAMAIGLVGTVAGRKFCGPTKSATHLFLLCTAPTGSGKGAPKKAGAQLLAAANLRGLIGPSSFTSASALIQHVSRSPASLCIMDEFSMLISKINSKNGTSHEKAISGEMRQFWSLSFEEYVPPRWAAGRDRMQPEPIISPALSLIGLTTADELYSVLQGADVVSGFLNRFLLVATLNNPLDVEPTADVFDPPQTLIGGLQAIATVGGPLAQATMHSMMPDRPLITVPWDGGPQSAAHLVFKALVATVAEMTEHEALTQRCAEMAVRLATVRAIGIGGPDAKVTEEDMKWGADFALWSTRRLIADVEAHLTETDHQARAKFVLRIIKESPGGYIARSALCRKVNHRFDARTLDMVLDGLRESEQVGLKESERRGSGRKASGYFAL